MCTRHLSVRILAILLCVMLLCGAASTTAFGQEVAVADNDTDDAVTEADDLSDLSDDVELEESASTDKTDGAGDSAAEPTQVTAADSEDGGDAAADEDMGNGDETVTVADDTDTETEDTADAPSDEMEQGEEALASDEPAAAADEDEVTVTYIPTTTAILTQDTGTNKKIILESYLTSTDDTTETIEPCDIIFVLDQSKWMNTVANKGEQRAAIIAEIKALLDDLPEPSTGGEHRIAIAGYGRVNMGAGTDPYNAETYPGVKATGNNISLNTGYYTASGFVSSNGWTDVSQSAMTGTTLPTMPTSYINGMTYDNAFMTIDEADNVLDNYIMAWYAAASRMDAGLTIAEQLAAIADAHDTNSERNLIVCVLASSLPIQNTNAYNINTIRTAAVLNAAQQLKSLGATIFAFGDYVASGKNISGTVQDTEDTFNSVMEQLCTQSSYFYSFSNFSSVKQALNEMISQIVIFVSEDADTDYTVEAQELEVSYSTEGKTTTWQDFLDYYGDSTASVIQNTVAEVEYYYFTGYDSDGNPTFETEPFIRLDVPLSKIVSGDGLSYQATLIPLPSAAAAQTLTTYYGSKVCITIAAPVTVTYKWASNEDGYAPSSAILPEQEIVVHGSSHTAAEVHTNTGMYDDHYEFMGWYTDAACTTAYTGTSALEGDLTLYGRWERSVLVEYYWNLGETGEYDDENPDWAEKVIYNTIPEEYTPEEQTGYSFQGWYLDKAYTTPYERGALTEDIKLYAKWTADEVSYQVLYYKQNEADGGYVEVTEDAQMLTGLTGETVSDITREYEGFFLDHVTYEDDANDAQEDPLPINGDGSLVVRVYYNPVPTWELCLYKESDSGTALPGALFALYTDDQEQALSAAAVISDGSSAQRKLTADGVTWYLMDVQRTDTEGKIRWPALTGEQYYLLELEAPEGYEIGSQPGQVVQADFGGISNVTVVNTWVYIPKSGISGMNAGLYALVAGTAAGLLAVGVIAKRKKRT